MKLSQFVMAFVWIIGDREGGNWYDMEKMSPQVLNMLEPFFIYHVLLSLTRLEIFAFPQTVKQFWREARGLRAKFSTRDFGKWLRHSSSIAWVFRGFLVLCWSLYMCNLMKNWIKQCHALRSCRGFWNIITWSKIDRVKYQYLCNHKGIENEAGFCLMFQNSHYQYKFALSVYAWTHSLPYCRIK